MVIPSLPVRPIFLAIAASLVAGCVTNPDGTTRLDDRATGALLGAVAGAGLAAATGNDPLVGAAVGATVGFFVGWYFESKKVADAKTVNAEYAGKKVTVPKNEVVPAAFTSNVKQTAPDAQGQREVQVTSNTDLIGYGDKTPNVQQKYALYDENNKLIEEKSEKLAAVDGAGRYTSTSKFKTPANAKGKTYTVKTTLVSNDKIYKENSYKVSFLGDGRTLLAMNP